MSLLGSLDSESLQAGAQVRDLKGTICDVTARLCEERFGSDLTALVLTGSLARDEATFLRGPDGWTVAGDAEFLALFGDGRRLPGRADFDDVASAATSRLTACGTRCEVTLAGVRPAFLRRLPPLIFAYELRECGQVILGDPTVLSLIPSFSGSEISREDAWRMLSNRIVEQLEVVSELADGAQALSPRAHYRTVKLYLDIATSLTVFAGIYQPTYRARMAALRSAATAASTTRWPFPPNDFLEDVAACTEWKLAQVAPAVTTGAEFMRRAIGYARQLWRWELARLTGLDDNLPEQSLLEAWMACQPRSARLRGWLVVLREEAGSSSWKSRLRWALRALGPSPRYGVYQAATTLLFSLANADGPAHPAWAQDWAAVEHALPVQRPRPSSCAPGWLSLGRNILWNYHHFLTGTRT